jgi:hypothetical protein
LRQQNLPSPFITHAVCQLLRKSTIGLPSW